MGKVLTWVIVGLVAWLAWRLYVVSRRRTERARGGDAASGRGGGSGEGPPPAAPATPELMMRCAVCGVHLPGSEAKFAAGRVFCSDEHRDRAGEVATAGRDDRDGR